MKEKITKEDLEMIEFLKNMSDKDFLKMAKDIDKEYFREERN